jgi:hypothetical protein
VSAVPILDVPGTTPAGEEVFLYASGATRLSNGVIVVADPGGPAVRYFDPSGRLLRSVGRRGEGPGEFSVPGWLGQCGADSVFVWDYMQQRMTVLDSAGRIAREYRVLRDPAFFYCSRDGLFAIHLSPREPVSPNEKVPHQTAPLWLADARGNYTRLLGELPIGENRPLGKSTRIAVGRDQLYVGTADSAFVEVYTLDGKHAGALPVGVAPRRPTERDYERAIDAQVAMLGDRETREIARRYLQAIPMPPYLPPYTNLLADPGGTLWVVTSAPGDPVTELRAIGLDGRTLEVLRLPVELTVFEVGHDHLLGMYEDEAGEPHLALYRLQRAQ